MGEKSGGMHILGDVLGECTVSILTSTKMRIISITSLETLFKFPYAAMFPWVLIAIIKLHLACVPIYMPGTTYNTISFLPLRIFLLSFPPLYNFHSHSCVYWIRSIKRTAGILKYRWKDPLSHLLKQQGKAEGRNPITRLMSAQDLMLGLRQGPVSWILSGWMVKWTDGWTDG